MSMLTLCQSRHANRKRTWTRLMRGLLLRALAFGALVFVLPSSLTGQALGGLRGGVGVGGAPGRWAGRRLAGVGVRGVLAGAAGAPTPAPRYALLVSDNPPTAAPRRI